MRTAALALFLANALGGLSYIWMKQASEGLPPFTIAFVRCVVGLACLGAWLRARRGVRWPFAGEDARPLAVAGVFGFAVPLALGVVGTDLSTAANGSILILLEPVAIVAFARILLGERVGGVRAAGLAAGLAGAGLVTLEGVRGGTSLLASENLVGNLALGLSGALWGLYTPVLAPVARRHAAVPVTFAVIAVATAALLPAALLEAPRWEAGPALLPALVVTVWMGVAITFAGTLLWNRSLRDLPPGVVAPFIFLQPAVGVLAGVLWLGESVSPRAGAGGLLVASGVVLVLWSERRRAREGGGSAATPDGGPRGSRPAETRTPRRLEGGGGW
jgi:drug/metabolite transporter (DMT)-like permease